MCIAEDRMPYWRRKSPVFSKLNFSKRNIHLSKDEEGTCNDDSSVGGGAVRHWHKFLYVTLFSFIEQELVGDMNTLGHHDLVVLNLET